MYIYICIYIYIYDHYICTTVHFVVLVALTPRFFLRRTESTIPTWCHDVFPLRPGLVRTPTLRQWSERPNLAYIAYPWVKKNDENCMEKWI